MDFPFPYTHIKPFSEDKENAVIVDKHFEQIFFTASNFLR
jgi:hypothetical protein